MGKIIEYALDKFTSIRLVDYESLLGVGHGYTVASFIVSRESWLANKTLRETRLRDEGVVVLGIYRRGKQGRTLYIGAPDPETVIKPGDELIVYGHEKVIENLSTRLKGRSGDLDHRRMVKQHMARKLIEKTEENL